MEYKENDWVLCEYKVQMIKRIEDGKIKEVSDGHCSHSSSDLSDRIFKLDLIGKGVSDNYESISSQLQRDYRNLNFPDIHRWMVEQWVLAMNVINEEDKLKERLDYLCQFRQTVAQKYRDISLEEFDGLRFFSR